MALGPGKYDALCTYVRETAQAEGAAVIVWGGIEGVGFSVQASVEQLNKLPAILRSMADTIEGHKGDVHSGAGNN